MLFSGCGGGQLQKNYPFATDYEVPIRFSPPIPVRRRQRARPSAPTPRVRAPPTAGASSNVVGASVLTRAPQAAGAEKASLAATGATRGSPPPFSHRSVRREEEEDTDKWRPLSSERGREFSGWTVNDM